MVFRGERPFLDNRSGPLTGFGPPREVAQEACVGTLQDFPQIIVC